MKQLSPYMHRALLIVLMLLSSIPATDAASAGPLIGEAAAGSTETAQERLTRERAERAAERAAEKRRQEAEAQAKKEAAARKKRREESWFHGMVQAYSAQLIAKKNDLTVRMQTQKPQSTETRKALKSMYKWEDDLFREFKYSCPSVLTSTLDYEVRSARTPLYARDEEDMGPNDEQTYKDSHYDSAKTQALASVNASIRTPDTTRYAAITGAMISETISGIIGTKDGDAKYYQTIMQEILQRCGQNIKAMTDSARLRSVSIYTPIAIKPLCGRYTADQNERTSMPDNPLAVEGIEAYRQGSSDGSVNFYEEEITLTSKEAVEARLSECIETQKIITKKILEKNLESPPGLDATELLKEGMQTWGNKSKEVEKATRIAQINADQSGKNMEKILKFIQDPKAWAAGGTAALAVTGGILVMYHGIPRLINKTPSIIAEKSFLTLYDKLRGTKLPPANFDQIVFTEEVGPRITRIMTHLHHVIEKGGEMMNLIFFGPPGTGKTMTAKALARSIGADYMLINASAFEQLTPGQAVSELEATFRLIRNNKKPVVVFFDEADAIMGRRGGGMETLTSRRVINTFLANVPDTHSRKVMFIFATNIPKSLDPAVLSRFPEEGWIYFGPPNSKERAEILMKYLDSFIKENGQTIGDDVKTNLPQYADELKSATGRDLRAIARGISDRMMDANGEVLSDSMVRSTLKELEANKKHMQSYTYASLNAGGGQAVTAY